MAKVEQLLAHNREWATRMLKRDPNFFNRLIGKQSPEYLWIGCSDSRVPANEILDLDPGEVFVHRNIANLVVHTDMNMLSVLEYAVEILRVKHIIVCGHYGCGGIAAASEPRQRGLIDNWLQHIRDVRIQHADQFKPTVSSEDQCNLLCELNVQEQVNNLCRTSVVQRAWHNKRSLSIHAWVYALSDGLLRPLQEPLKSVKQLPASYSMKL